MTDRFAPAPGVKPAPCNLTDFNNGSWAGITHNLDFIQDMGMTAIWITPIPYQYQGISDVEGITAYHGYWAQDLYRVDPHWGTEQDLQDMIKAAHDKGMLTMLDVVGNHVGPVEVEAVYPFNKTEHYNDCSGCVAHCSIPTPARVATETYPVKKNDLDLVTSCRVVNLPDLNQSHPFVREALVNWVQDILHKFPFDAIRMDTVKHAEIDFWKDFTAAAKTFSIGEVYNFKSMFLADYVRRGSDGKKPMDSVLNMPLYSALNETFALQQDMRGLAAERKLQLELYGRDQVQLLGNFVDNHDFPRFLALQPDVVLFKNALTWVLLAEGIPIIYYGSAAQMDGGLEGGRNRACLWEKAYNRESELYRLIATLSKLRTSRQLWKISERQENVTADCYTYTVGPDVLVVTTNRGGNSANATGACAVTLPADSQLMKHGLKGLKDVLDYDQAENAAPAGISWDPKSNRLIIDTPGGNPRVLTNTPSTGSYIKHSTSEVKEIGKAQDEPKLIWPTAMPADKNTKQASSAVHAAAAVAAGARWFFGLLAVVLTTTSVLCG